MIAKAPPILTLVVDPLVADVPELARAIRVQHARSVLKLAIKAVVHRANAFRIRRAAAIPRGLRVDDPRLPAACTKGAMHQLERSIRVEPLHRPLRLLPECREPSVQPHIAMVQLT